MADHARPVQYELPVRPDFTAAVDKRTLYIHKPAGRRGLTLGDATGQFVDSGRSGADAG
jgi:hypothetical protein